MTVADSPRPPGRPRSRQADTDILAAALDLLIECGAGQTSIEKVAQRAGVTRATVYRRFTDKSALLVQAIESGHTDHDPATLDWPDIDSMLTDWARYLSRPRNRRMLRRLYGSVDDYPELLAAYRNSPGRHRASAVGTMLSRARDDGRLPPESDVRILQEMLNGAVLHHLGAYPDTGSADDIKTYLAAMLRQAGYRPAGASR
ncbi:AcrR family transcriptional regulator [Streptosporangium album]|uniref:AcrR family transcriptional regulator n=1 Tax=Streptosporangium album TaxID=47479 RepID=A0A7W7W8H1_9ACTN|nr:TetR/AcrR family transcriptional regulator [Streptosporangium album]MBB4936975.1 AcrR family transcriptional regulator [Streptosporangium album]